jgi:hypothetical protein
VTSVAVLACLLDLAGGSVLPGPAEGEAEFRYADVVCSVAPSVVRPGGAAELTVRLTPRAGVAWHEAPLAPSRVGVRPDAGWAADVAEIALPPAETPQSPRQFAVRLRAGGELTGYEVIELRIRYGVRVEGPAAGEDMGEDAGVNRSDEKAGERADEEKEDEKRAGGPPPAHVVFEQATLTVELPAALPAMALPAARGENEDDGDRDGRDPGLDPTAPVAPLPRRAGPPEDTRGSPVVPALVFALAAALVFVGLAAWIRGKRRDGEEPRQGGGEPG